MIEIILKKIKKCIKYFFSSEKIKNRDKKNSTDFLSAENVNTQQLGMTEQNIKCFRVSISLLSHASIHVSPCILSWWLQFANRAVDLNGGVT